MKILFCTTTFEHGKNGPTRFARCLSQQLADESKAEFHVLSEDITVSSSHHHKVSLGWGRLVFRPIGMIYRNWPYYRTVKALHQKHRFDVIWHNNAIHGMLTAWLVDTPSIGMINDALGANNSWQNFSFSWQWFRYAVFSWMEKRCQNFYPLLVVNSYYLRDTLIDRYQIEPNRLEVLYKTVNSSIGLPAKGRLTKKLDLLNPIKVLFVKANYTIGDLSRLVSAMNTLEYRFKLFIVGPQISVVQAYLDTLSIKENIEVVLKGPLKNNEVLSLHQACDIFCTPSITEALGVANMEALLMGTPVVYHAVGGVNEVLKNGQYGFQDKDGTIHSLAVALASCILNEEERKNRTKAGQQFVMSHFADDKMIKEFLALSKSVSEAR